MGTLTYNKNLSHLREVSAADMGVDTVAGNATTEGTWIKSAGYNQCSLMLKYLHVSGGGNLTFNIGVSNDAGTTEYFLQTAATSSGVATLSTLDYKLASLRGSTNIVIDFPLNYEYFRIANLTLSSGASADKITITAFLGNL